MNTPEIRQMPDVPEIKERFLKCVDELREQILPVLEKFGPAIFINCYMCLLIESTTFTLKTKEEFEGNIKTLCELIEKNTMNYYKLLQEKEDE